MYFFFIFFLCLFYAGVFTSFMQYIITYLIHLTYKLETKRLRFNSACHYLQLFTQKLGLTDMVKREEALVDRCLALIIWKSSDSLLPVKI